MVNCKIFYSQSVKSGQPIVKYFTLKTSAKYFTKVTHLSRYRVLSQYQRRAGIALVFFFFLKKIFQVILEE